MWLCVVRFCLIRLNHFGCFSWKLVELSIHCWWPWWLCTQGCTIKDWHPTVAMPFCDPQLLRALRALMAGQMGGKGKATHRSLVPHAWDVTLVQMFTLFLFFFQLSSFNSLEGDWRLPEIWRSWILLRCQASWMWLADDYDGCALCTWGHRSLNITPISICFCLSTITYGSQWNVGIEGK